MKSYSLQQNTQGTDWVRDLFSLQWFFCPADTSRKSNLFVDKQRCLKNTDCVGGLFNTNPICYSLEKKLFSCFWRSRRKLVDVSAGSAVHPTEPWRPFTSWALRGHAMLDEWGQPLAFMTPLAAAVSANHPRYWGCAKKLRHKGGRELGKGGGVQCC